MKGIWLLIDEDEARIVKQNSCLKVEIMKCKDMEV